LRFIAARWRPSEEARIGAARGGANSRDAIRIGLGFSRPSYILILNTWGHKMLWVFGAWGAIHTGAAGTTGPLRSAAESSRRDPSLAINVWHTGCRLPWRQLAFERVIGSRGGGHDREFRRHESPYVKIDANFLGRTSFTE
jgi:hypothetical protein